ncbi:hypothetical protein [Halomicrococcus sp. SG-WS-1]|uniref:hypothetical protein n=1 Tax=Halomicrococcus sp. SG-WS-1 TaxID=3439057 RepID=UPI003F7A0F46
MDSTQSEPAGEPPDTNMERRSALRNRLLEWVKVDGDRLFLTIGISVGVFVLILVLNSIGAVAFTNDNSVTRMASGMIAGTFSLVTLVVSVNQLILSQEFSPASEHRNRFSGVMEFRRDLEEQTGVSTAPVEPTRVVEVLAEAIGDRASELSDSVANSTDEEFRQQVTQYAKSVEDSTKWIDEAFDQSDVEAFDALSVAVEYADGWQIHVARRLRNDASELTDETAATFDELIDTIRLFSTAQEHLKTVYLQRELAKFSQLTIYCGIPAVLSSISIALLYGDIGGATISTRFLPYVTSLLVTIVLVPLVLLAVFILRTATVTRRTSTVGPLLLQRPSNEKSVQVTINDTD